MTAPPSEKLRALASQERWEQALDLLRRLDPDDAARLLMDIPFEEQQALFRRFPVNFAAELAAALPYYHTYVLLHSRPAAEMNAIVEQMDPAERLQFFDELPEETWQRLMDELSGQQPAEGVAAVPAVEHAPPAAAIIQALQVEKRFERPDGGEVQVIAPMDLAVEPGVIIALLGPSGSGKSTLLRILTGLTAPSGGEVLWHGKPLGESSPNVAIVFQSFALFPWLTVEENVEAGLDAIGLARAEAHRRTQAAIELIDLDGFQSAYPRELSGGMRQRVGFARAMVVEPVLLLMDEPFSALDVLTAESLRTDFMDLWIERQLPTKSVLIVTHNIDEAVMMCDRILVLSSNPGRIAAEIPVALAHPRDRQDSEFRNIVDEIYSILTSRTTESLSAGNHARGAFAHPLPSVTVNRLMGFVDTLAASPYNGQAELAEIAGALSLDVGALFMIAEALHMLEFAELKESAIKLTAAGRLFTQGDTEERKLLFREHLLRFVPLAAHIHHVLSEREDHRAPRERFELELEDRLNEGDAEKSLRAVIGWGRYAELFEYDDDARIFAAAVSNGESAL
jgi:NitT/TauT family transport system ATP-binding protein